jgi:soluble lytic murein transglycosylase
MVSVCALKLLEALDYGEASASGDISPKGAKGNMQLMDPLGKEYHRRLGIKEAYNPHDDEQARQIASAFISDLINKYDSDPALIAAAYNMGERNLDRFIKQYGREWSLIAPHLKGDFVETKNYVTRILKYLG